MGEAGSWAMTSAVRWIKPQSLQRGSQVRVVAPAGPFDQAGFDAGLAVISARYKPQFRDDISTVHRYLAGDDDRRSAELAEALSDTRARAVFCARGGYGSARLLQGLNLEAATSTALVGFSDITSLHLASQAVGRVTIHGPVLTQLGRQPEAVRDNLFRMLESAEPPPPIRGTETFVPGRVEGRLLGGNLSVFSRLLGTPFMPALTGAVLLLEDVGERPYRLDRMWTHLQLAGVFEQVRGIVLGDFTNCEEKGAPYSSEDVLRSLARETKLPCAWGFPVGHGEVNYAVPLGTQVRFDAGQATLTFLEGAVEP